MTSGVPQGTVLAPLLFLCFVNDIPASIQCKIRLYADYILLYSEISSTNDCIRLQNDINYLSNWFETWLLQFNPAKCMHLRISNRRLYIKSIHITWTDLSLKKCPLRIILVLPLIRGSLGQIMLQGLSPKQIQFWAFLLLLFYLFYFMALWYSKKKLYLQAEPRVCEQPVFTAQQNYINYSYL